jgi:hypothetical protein
MSAAEGTQRASHSDHDQAGPALKPEPTRSIYLTLIHEPGTQPGEQISAA